MRFSKVFLQLVVEGDEGSVPFIFAKKVTKTQKPEQATANMQLRWSFP